jgi:putative Ca2+/H+ antiporter (TMEM165/GDT1 family)
MNKHAVELDDKSRQQIAALSAFIGAGLAVFAAVHVSDRANPLIAGVVGFVLSFVASLIARRIGVAIIALGCFVLLANCAVARG